MREVTQTRLGILVGVGAVAGMLATVPPAQAQDCTTLSPTLRKCTINRPAVTRQRTEYATVNYAAGNKVTIKATGCAQTGGSGATWKRYVNPKGEDSDVYYYGTFSLPGNTPAGGNYPLRTYLKSSNSYTKEFFIPSTTSLPTSVLHLWLGYSDDDYGDNGYDDRDDGTDDQCAGLSDAKVEVWIDSSNPPPPPPPPPLAFDVVPGGTDPNGFKLNPQWGYQQANPGSLPDPLVNCLDLRPPGTGGFPASCSRDPFTLDQPTTSGDIIPSLNYLFCHGEWPFADEDGLWGHVNWFPVTYTGKLTFDAWSGNLLECAFQADDCVFDGDDDYNFLLETSGKAGVTTQNDPGPPKTILIEADSDDLFDTLQHAWWANFRAEVDAQGPTNTTGPATSHISGLEATVAGLIGLDMGHSGHSELHPIYAMSILDKTLSGNKTVPGEGPVYREVWPIMVRNYGNEGYCSETPHPLYLNETRGNYTFSLPVRAGKKLIAYHTDFRQELPTGGTAYPTIEVITSNGMPSQVKVTFNFGANQQSPPKTLFDGVLYLDWQP